MPRFNGWLIIIIIIIIKNDVTVGHRNTVSLLLAICGRMHEYVLCVFPEADRK